MTKKEKLLIEYYTYAKEWVWYEMNSRGTKKLSMGYHILTGRLAMYLTVLDDLANDYETLKKEFEAFKITYPKP